MATVTRSRPATVKPRNDIYTGLLAISFLALLTSAILLFLDSQQYGSTKAPTALKLPAPSAPGSPFAPSGPGGPGASGAPGGTGGNEGITAPKGTDVAPEKGSTPEKGNP